MKKDWWLTGTGAPGMQAEETQKARADETAKRSPKHTGLLKTTILSFLAGAGRRLPVEPMEVRGSENPNHTRTSFQSIQTLFTTKEKVTGVCRHHMGKNECSYW